MGLRACDTEITTTPIKETTTAEPTTEAEAGGPRTEEVAAEYTTAKEEGRPSEVCKVDVSGFPRDQLQNRVCEK